MSNHPFERNPFADKRRPPWRCIAEDPIGVVVTHDYYKPVCPTHGHKKCLVRRFVHHADGCRQGKWRGPEACATDVALVTCHNCLAKLGFRECVPCAGKGPDGVCTRCGGHGYYHKGAK